MGELRKDLLEWDLKILPKELNLWWTMRWDEIVRKTVVKSKFYQVNDKRFYFLDGVVLLPFGHPCLSEIDKFKQEKGQKIEQ